jgi:hypothetical protein
MAPRKPIIGTVDARAAGGQAAAAPPISMTNSRLFNRSNCIRWPNQLGAACRIGEGHVSALLRCGISARLMSAAGQKPKLPHCNNNGGFHLKERT